MRKLSFGLEQNFLKNKETIVEEKGKWRIKNTFSFTFKIGHVIFLNLTL
jgi:hypothetical protein